MVRKAVEVQVSSQVLRWARERSGYSKQDVASKLKVPESLVSSWEAEDQNIAFSKIKALAALFKRPEATLLLSKPPSTDPFPAFRNKNKSGNPYAPKTLLSIRRAKRLQKSLKQLLGNLNHETEVRLSFATLKDDPREIANRERASFGLDMDMQRNWQSDYDALNFWKRGLEGKNIFIFQMKMPVEDARGFSFADASPYVIVLNTSDSVTARNFTLFHEYAHLLLKSSSVCTPSFGDKSDEKNADAAESWCNRFSAAFLMPTNDILHAYSQYENQGIDRATSRVSRLFGVSRQAILMRLSELNLISESDFKTEYAKVQSQVQARLVNAAKKKVEFVIPPSTKSFNERGSKYVSLVLNNLDRKMISPIEFSDFLSLKIQHLDKIRELAARGKSHV
ncbi:MAG: XRE family transcriptional regulator [Candidatus Micrarchaeota archaeon]